MNVGRSRVAHVSWTEQNKKIQIYVHLILIYKAQFCLCVCFNSSETAEGTNIKLATIDHHFVVSVTTILVKS